MTLIDQIKASVQIADLDEAVRPIQEIIGVTDGGNADGFFCHLEDGEWAEMSQDGRIRLLVGYVDEELACAL